MNQHENDCCELKEHRTYLASIGDKLTPIQLTVLNTIQTKSVKSHLENMHIVKNHCFQLGIYEDDLFLMTKYIEEQAPIIIHFNMSPLLSNFVKDTQYRSLFETNTSLGSTNKLNRKQW